MGLSRGRRLESRVDDGKGCNGLSRFLSLTKKRNVMSNVPFLKSGAEEETRTLTPERELDPEPSVSTNSTTSARREF